ncbi:hypothetical protein GOBAR_AA38038 [Gossypium barbadense]|uniref:Uncharacterized protein n=1 Tax=Gossypium barbadense TaxID=3634 RepID=A0A2P5VV31_GOSBA|nr:hypothetical protein GOBAR_AA38038 [Gossypium barbadense]
MEMNFAPNIKSCRRNLPRSSIGRANLADFFEQSWTLSSDSGNLLAVTMAIGGVKLLGNQVMLLLFRLAEVISPLKLV